MKYPATPSHEQMPSTPGNYNTPGGTYIGVLMNSPIHGMPIAGKWTTPQVAAGRRVYFSNFSEIFYLHITAHLALGQ